MNDMPRLFPEDAPRIAVMTGPFGGVEEAFQILKPMTIARVIETREIVFRLPTVAVMLRPGADPEPVLREDWATVKVHEGETLAFVGVPGRGGHGGGKQIVGLIASLALAVAAPFVGGAVAGALGFTQGTIAFGIVKGIASLAFLAGGSLLLNALFPPPKTPSDVVETVYSVNASGNSASPLDVIPCQYGTLRAPPKFAARPYQEYVDNDQFLYQLFCVGVGDHSFTKIEIGDTEAWNSVDGYSDTFDDLTFEFVHPGDDITLFPANVVTSDEVASLQVPDPPDVLGPYVVNSAGTTINRLAVDFAFPGGLYTQNDSGEIGSRSIRLVAEYRTVGGSTWQTLFAETFTFATRTPQRITRAADVADGRYEVRFRSETTFASDNANAFDKVSWVSARGYLSDFTTPEGVTLLAMRIRANEQLSSASSAQIFVTATRLLPVFDGTSWSDPVATESIAWAAADLLRDTDYGLGLSDAQYDLAALYALSQTWASRGDHFNAQFDRKWTSQDALAAILRAGRAQPVRIGGKVGFIRDEVKTIRRKTFTARNVVRGSFHHRFVLFDEEKPDYIRANYVDRAVWSDRQLEASLASVGAEEPQEVSYFGIIDHDQVWREAVTEAAVNAYRREFCGFTAEWDGKLLTRMEPIQVLHPFVEGVALAAVVERVGDTFTVDRDLEIIAGDAYVILRGKDGMEWGPVLVDSQPAARTIALDAVDRAIVEAQHGNLDDIWPSETEELPHLMLCEGETRPFNGLVVSATPNGPDRIDVLVVNDAPEVYLADQTETAPPAWSDPVLPPAVPTVPIIYGLTATAKVAVAGVAVDAMWQPAAGASSYLAEISYDSGSTWTPLYSGQGNRFSMPIQPQPFKLRVAGIGTVRGPWAIVTLGTSDLPEELFGRSVVPRNAFDARLEALVKIIDTTVQNNLVAARDAIDAALEEMGAAVNEGWALRIKEQNSVIESVGQRTTTAEARITTAETAIATNQSALAQFFKDLVAITAAGEAQAQFQMTAQSLTGDQIAAMAFLMRAGVGGEFAEAAMGMAAYFSDAIGRYSRVWFKADNVDLITPAGTRKMLTMGQTDGYEDDAPDAGEIEPNLLNRQLMHRSVLTQNCTLRAPLTDGVFFWFHAFVQDGTGGWDVTPDPAAYIGEPPAINTGANVATLCLGLAFSVSPPLYAMIKLFEGVLEVGSNRQLALSVAVDGRTIWHLDINGPLTIDYSYDGTITPLGDYLDATVELRAAGGSTGGLGKTASSATASEDSFLETEAGDLLAGAGGSTPGINEATIEAYGRQFLGTGGPAGVASGPGTNYNGNAGGNAGTGGFTYDVKGGDGAAQPGGGAGIVAPYQGAAYHATNGQQGNDPGAGATGPGSVSTIVGGAFSRVGIGGAGSGAAIGKVLAPTDMVNGVAYRLKLGAPGTPGWGSGIATFGPSGGIQLPPAQGAKGGNPKFILT